MNIFYIHENPITCAKWMGNKHVVKMILETAQMLCTAHRILDGKQVTKLVTSKSGKSKLKKVWVHPEYDDVLYMSTHANHPSNIWIRSSFLQYMWAYHHFVALCKEYTYRYGKIHSTEIKLIDILSQPPNNIIKVNSTSYFEQPPSCMDEQYIFSDNSITNYRIYYARAKKNMHKWTKREIPEFIERMMI